MEYKTVTVGSITYAQRAKSLLLSRHIHATIVRARATGCSWGVRLNAEDAARACELLRHAGMKTEVS